MAVKQSRTFKAVHTLAVSRRYKNSCNIYKDPFIENQWNAMLWCCIETNKTDSMIIQLNTNQF